AKQLAREAEEKIEKAGREARDGWNDAKHNDPNADARHTKKRRSPSKALKKVNGGLDLTGMKTLTRFYGIGILTATLMAPVAAVAQDHRTEERREAENNRRYQDARHHDEHVWNNHEDQ